jgi:hypothetical protein
VDLVIFENIAGRAEARARIVADLPARLARARRSAIARSLASLGVISR